VEAGTHYPVMNLGHNQPLPLIDFLKLMERLSGKTAELTYVPARSDEMPMTWANIFRAKQYLGWEPTTDLERGLSKFLTWFTANRL
jgi:UDP-glucuronate 4-epimerase